MRTGILKASGVMRLFMDAGSSTSIEELGKLIPYLSKGFDIVIGSRRITGANIAVKQSILRECLGFVFRKLARFVIGTSVLDSQNGFKLFTAKSAELIFQKSKINGWSFDLEVLVIANKLGLKIKEVPIVWRNDSQSKMNFSSMIGMLRDIFILYCRN